MDLENWYPRTIPVASSCQLQPCVGSDDAYLPNSKYGCLSLPSLEQRALLNIQHSTNDSFNLHLFYTISASSSSVLSVVSWIVNPSPDAVGVVQWVKGSSSRAGGKVGHRASPPPFDVGGIIGNCLDFAIYDALTHYSNTLATVHFGRIHWLALPT